MAKLTRHFIETEIKLPTSGQRFYRDDDIAGFAVRATPKSKSFVLEKRVDGVARRITIGKCSQISLESAKSQACIMLGDIARGCDPKTGKRINTAQDITLLEVLEKFLEVRNLRTDTQRNYQFAVHRHFKDWLDLPINTITKDMCDSIF